MLMDYPHEVTVKIDALAASAASVIAGWRNQGLHEPRGHADDPQSGDHCCVIGDTEEMQKAIDMCKQKSKGIHHERLRNQVRAFPCKDLKLMDAETWMNAKEAKKLGFLDEILFAEARRTSAGRRDGCGDTFLPQSRHDSLLSLADP